MKKIAITQRLIDTQSYFEWRDCLDIRWGKLLAELDFIPILLPIEYDYKKIFQELHIDGVIFSGGNDLVRFSNNELSKKRDTFEKEILKYSILNKIPVLGVCRGIQLIGDYFGAALTQVPGHVGTKHELDINLLSKYANLLINLGEVNSFHNYAIETIPDNFIISAKSRDGVIEAIEHSTEKIFGIMWHSERVDPFDQSEKQLIKEFFND